MEDGDFTEEIYAKIAECQSKRVVVIYSKRVLTLQDKMLEYEVLQEIKTDTLFFASEENKVLLKEIPIIEDDLYREIFSYIDNAFEVEDESVFFYISEGDVKQISTVIMGENGSGKTTLAQAFTWCLYGATDFDDQIVLNKAIAQNIGPNGEASVQVKISMVHLGVDYIMTREQKYTTDSIGGLKRPNNTVFKIQYKNKDGQQDFVKESEVDLRMKEILPKELAKYFFFDGERIGNMSKEIRKGKSKEFADAVKSLLGLSAFTEALEHLGGRSANNGGIK